MNGDDNNNALLGGDVLVGKRQKPFPEFDYDFIFIFRNDVLVNLEMMNKLMSHDKDFVSGAFRKADRSYDIIENFDNVYFQSHGRFEYVSQEKMDTWTSEKKLIPVDSVGAGAICLKKGVIEKLEYPWFRPVFYEILTRNGTRIVDFCDEITGFCRCLKDAGVDLFVDPLVRASFQTPMIF